MRQLVAQEFQLLASSCEDWQSSCSWFHSWFTSCNFLLKLWYSIHVTEYCAVIGHALYRVAQQTTVKEVSDVFLFCGMRCGHVRQFHFCLGLEIETWGQASLTHSLRVHDLNRTNSLVSFQWSGLSDQWMLLLTKNCQKRCLYKGRGVVSTPICANKVKNGPASANQGPFTAS